MMPKFHPDHAVEIVAPKYGSAYRIGGRLVLTCKHLFDDDNRCKVRFRSPSNYSDKQDIDAKVIWKAPDNIDIALVELPETIKACDPVSFGQLPEVNSAERVEFDFFGWPSWGFVNLQDGNKATGLHIDGIIYLADRSASGLLTLEANRTPSELEVEQCNKQGKSPWQGASGAAIVCNGLVVGVQKWHQNPDRPKSLEAESLARIYNNQEWCELLEKHGINVNPIPIHSSSEQARETIPQNLKKSGVIEFVGREDVLSRIHNKLQKTERFSISILSGMGGIGKTELALQYARQEWKKGTYQGGICWINLESNDPSSDVISFFKTKLKFGEPKGTTPSEKVQYCWDNWIDGDALIIFDAVRDYAQIEDYLPSLEPNKFKIIITTRYEFLSDIIENIHLEELSENASLDLLRSYLGKDRINTQIEQSKLLTQDLGYLPLALELIARLLRRRTWTIEYIRGEFKKRGLKDNTLLSENHSEMTSKKGVKIAFDLSWDELNDQPQAQKLALYLSLFAVAPIKKIWINELFPHEDGYDIDKWLIDNLVNLNLVKDLGNNEYELHRLIHLYLGEKLDESEINKTTKQDYCKLLILKCHKFTHVLSLHEIEELKPIVAHTKQVIQLYYDYIIDDYEDNIPNSWNIPIKTINHFYVSQGFHPEAIEFFNKYLQITKNKFGEDDIHLMVICNDFALTLKECGEHERAMELLNQALSVSQKCLGENHDQTLTITNAIGDTYRQMEDYDKAEEILTNLYYEILDEILKREHQKPSEQKELYKKFVVFILVHNNLALVYQEIKKYNEAENCYKFALQYLKEFNASIYFAQASNSLACMYVEQKRYQEAEYYFDQALQINKTLDSKHINYRLNLSNLAAFYISQNRLDEAEKLWLELFEIELNLLHLDLEPTGLDYLHSIVSQYFYRGLYGEVEKLSSKINHLYQKFGLIYSIEYCDSLNLLAKSYIRLEKSEEAISLVREAIQVNKKLYPKLDNMTVIDSYDTLGMAWWNLAQELVHWTVRSSRKINEFTRVSAPNVLHPSSRLTIAERLSMQGF
jgi:tetratricopeptide (TPR) repeat protein